MVDEVRSCRRYNQANPNLAHHRSRGGRRIARVFAGRKKIDVDQQPYARSQQSTIYRRFCPTGVMPPMTRLARSVVLLSGAFLAFPLASCADEVQLKQSKTALSDGNQSPSEAKQDKDAAKPDDKAAKFDEKKSSDEK